MNVQTNKQMRIKRMIEWMNEWMNEWLNECRHMNNWMTDWRRLCSEIDEQLKTEELTLFKLYTSIFPAPTSRKSLYKDTISHQPCSRHSQYSTTPSPHGIISQIIRHTEPTTDRIICIFYNFPLVHPLPCHRPTNHLRMPCANCTMFPHSTVPIPYQTAFFLPCR